LILCSARSGDGFTVAQRGFDGTTQASHADGAPVIHGPVRYMINHLWQNVADTFNPDVPGYARVTAIAPGTYDDEFESQSGSWHITPTPAGGDLLDFNVVPSCMRFQRADFSTTNYIISKSFPVGSTTFDAICRMSHGAREWGQTPIATPPAVECSFFVSDQATPSSADVGNVARIDHIISGQQFTLTDVYGRINGAVNSTWPTRTDIIKSAQVSHSVYSPVNIALHNGAQYYRITSNAGTSFQLWAGDGMTWKQVGFIGTPINVASIGWRFLVGAPASSVRTQQHAVVDFLRIKVGSYYSGSGNTYY
jgi:hypothetical protein